MMEVINKEHLIHGLRDMVEWSSGELHDAQLYGDKASIAYWKGCNITYTLLLSKIENMTSHKVDEYDL